MLKSVFVVFIFAIVVIAHDEHDHADDDDALKEHFTKATLDCIVKTRFSLEGLQKLQADDLSPTENVQCFQKCFFENAGIIKDKAIDSATIYALDRLDSKVDKRLKTKANLEKCTPLYKADTFDCDAAWELYKCFN